MGMLPHTSPRDVFASEVYKEEFQQWKTRTGAGDLSFKDFLPDISLPKADCDFHLVIDKGLADNLVSFCGLGVKISPTEFEMHFVDYMPDRNIDVLILQRRPVP